MGSLHARQTFRDLPSAASRTFRQRFLAPQLVRCMGHAGGRTFFLDDFVNRQFEGGHAAQIDVTREEFLSKAHEHYALTKSLTTGYAPFCKHLFLPNFTGASLNAIEITDTNQHLLRSGYSRRRPDELAVLSRWFPAQAVERKRALFLDVILYSREQLLKEHNARLGHAAADLLPHAPWGIISIKPQDEDYETPMQPITIMRNALGKDEGGSGIALDRQAYDASVKYWKAHAPIIDGNPAGE